MPSRRGTVAPHSMHETIQVALGISNVDCDRTERPWYERSRWQAEWRAEWGPGRRYGRRRRAADYGPQYMLHRPQHERGPPAPSRHAVPGGGIRTARGVLIGNGPAPRNPAAVLEISGTRSGYILHNLASAGGYQLSGVVRLFPAQSVASGSPPTCDSVCLLRSEELTIKWHTHQNSSPKHRPL